MQVKGTDPDQDLQAFLGLFQRAGFLLQHPLITMQKINEFDVTKATPETFKREIAIPAMQLIMFLLEMIKDTNFIKEDDTWTRGFLNFFFHKMMYGNQEEVLKLYPMGFILWDFDNLGGINDLISPENADEYMRWTNQIIHGCIWRRRTNVPWNEELERRTEHRRMPQAKARTKSGDEKCAFIAHSSLKKLETSKGDIYRTLETPEAEFVTVNVEGQRVAFPPSVTVSYGLMTSPFEVLKTFLEKLERRVTEEKEQRRPKPERKKEPIRGLRVLDQVPAPPEQVAA